ncbi:hypothetical protein RB619_20915 [Flavobacterium sp. LHD-80]|uniref:hypothetical protein n=1 Tax=Flavobacterium sp. LHD-80 TaxID=3071411 RepID=UPI0027DFDD9F|nr:hypothetical protein [Flavobacterium sp. LHD-80]MDQ6473109.1 hypothetical protein [Flavobacterium sp. LHD-80]
MKYSMLIVFFVLLSCKHSNQEIRKPDNYTLSEKNVSEDCNVYQMRFYKEEYIFRFALTGPCKNLSLKSYLSEYSDYLSRNGDSLINKRGLIIIEYYELNKKEVQDSILHITKKSFKTDVSLYETEDNRFVLKVSKQCKRRY